MLLLIKVNINIKKEFKRIYSEDDYEKKENFKQVILKEKMINTDIIPKKPKSLGLNKIEFIINSSNQYDSEDDYEKKENLKQVLLKELVSKNDSGADEIKRIDSNKSQSNKYNVMKHNINDSNHNKQNINFIKLKEHQKEEVENDNSSQVEDNISENQNNEESNNINEESDDYINQNKKNKGLLLKEEVINTDIKEVGIFNKDYQNKKESNNNSDSIHEEGVFNISEKSNDEPITIIDNDTLKINNENVENNKVEEDDSMTDENYYEIPELNKNIYNLLDNNENGCINAPQSELVFDGNRNMQVVEFKNDMVENENNDITIENNINEEFQHVDVIHENNIDNNEENLNNIEENYENNRVLAYEPNHSLDNLDGMILIMQIHYKEDLI